MQAGLVTCVLVGLHVPCSCFFHVQQSVCTFFLEPKVEVASCKGTNNYKQQGGVVFSLSLSLLYCRYLIRFELVRFQMYKECYFLHISIHAI